VRRSRQHYLRPNQLYLPLEEDKEGGIVKRESLSRDAKDNTVFFINLSCVFGRNNNEVCMTIG